MAQASYYFRFYLAPAMVHAGLGDEYIAQLEPWRKMVDLGLSTWAETPEPTRSDSHAWSAHPTLDLMTIVAGIAPGSPGFATVRISPHLGNLQCAEATMPTPDGLVEVHYVRNDTRWKAAVTIPSNLSGELSWHGRIIPLHSGHQEISLPREARLVADPERKGEREKTVLRHRAWLAKGSVTLFPMLLV
jgi:hypothetical protein